MNKLHIKFFLFLAFFMLTAATFNAQTTKDFTMRQVVCGLQMPWEITYGPDNFIWTTETRGYKVSRINPADGSTTVLLDLSNNKNFPNFPTVSPQGGLMGLALHPQLLSGKPYVYLAYVYNYVNSLPNTGGDFFKTKVVRYTYNAANQTLTNEEVLCDTIPGSSDHNGGRMTIAPVNGQNFLFYSVGDMGAGQFGNANRQNHAQNTNFYEGKILRFNIEPDADAGAFDKWNPNDNPFGNAIWSFGHRNPQGLVNVNGKLFEAEHGPYSDDEINIIERAANYGHPLVVGYADGNYNGAAVGFGTGVPIIQDEVANAASLGSAYRNPLKSYFPEINANVRAIYQNYVNNTIPANNYFLSWNSIAPSGIDYYNSTAIPNWKNSILITSLKRRRIYRLQLDATSTSIVSDTLPLFEDMGRYRDIAISPDGTKIYVSCDSEGQTSGPTIGTTIDPPNKGCILEFTYNPPVVNTNSCRYQDSLELVKLYNSTNGANWTNKWDLTKPMTTWYGVTLNANGCVDTIVLSNNNLSGTFPAVFDFPELISLYIANNQNFAGTVPNFNSPKLEAIGFYNNKLSGVVPDFSKTNLSTIGLSLNPFTGLSDLNLPRLKYFNAENTLISNIPKFNTPNLVQLTIASSQLMDTIPNFNLPNLEQLFLQGNKLTGKIINFTNLPKLFYLSLYDNQLSGEIPDFKNLINLSTLSLYRNKLSGSIPDFNLPNLKSIIVSDNNLSGCIPASLKAFCGKSVYLNNNPNLATQDFNAFCNNNTGACTTSAGSCDAITATANDNSISLSGLTNLNQIQVFNNNWSANVFSQNITASSVTIPNLTSGQTYHVKIQQYNTSSGAWVFVCNRTIDVTTGAATHIPDIPDTHFASAIKAVCASCITINSDGTGNLAQPAAGNLTSLNADGQSIKDLTGVLGLTGLTQLTCHHNLLTSLPNLPSGLITLDCADNQLTNLPTLPSGLTNLNCNTNLLTILPTLPTGLTLLACIYNQLTSLPALPSGLTDLRCSSNQLTSLPNLPSGLTQLTCNTNLLTSLPTLPSGLKNLVCSSNPFTRLPTLPTGLATLYFDNTKIPCITYAGIGLQLYNGASIFLGLGQNYPPCTTFFACDAITATATDNSITLSGLTNLNQIQVFNNNWSAKVFSQNVTVSSVTVPNLTGGQTYHVKIQQYNTSTGAWVFVCERTIDVTVGGSGSGNNLPDLTLVNLNLGATNVAQGQILNWKVDIKNIGTGNAPGNFNVKAYFSKDTILSADDVQSGIIPTGGYDAGFSVVQVPGSSLVLNTLAAVQYYLILKVDADNQVTESNENNNVIVSAVPLTVTTTSLFGCDAVSVTTNNNSITLSGLSNLNTIQVFNNNWSSRVFNQNITANSATIPNLTSGQTYHVKIQQYNTSTGAWVFVCDKTIDVIAGTGIAPKLAQERATQHVPIVVNKIFPNPTLDEIKIELESIKPQSTEFLFYNTLGTLVRSEKRTLEQGINNISFDVSNFVEGIYFVIPQTNIGRKVPTKFVKE